MRTFSSLTTPERAFQRVLMNACDGFDIPTLEYQLGWPAGRICQMVRCEFLPTRMEITAICLVLGHDPDGLLLLRMERITERTQHVQMLLDSVYGVTQ